MRKGGTIPERKGTAQAALGRCALACLLLLAAIPAFSAVKANGDIEITDDLAAGFAGSVALGGGDMVLSGSLGQVAVSYASGAGGVEVESGYFSKFVSTPASFGHGAVYPSSTSVTATAATIPNPSATLYEIETSSAQDFTGAVILVSSTGWPAPITGLTGNTTYYTRLRASYMGEDRSPYTPTATFLTLPATPTLQGFTGVFSSSITVGWDAAANSPETRYLVQAANEQSFGAGVYTTVYGSSHTFAGLSPNTTWFVRLKAIGALEDATPYVLFGSTITTAVVPSTTVPCAVSSVTITGYWASGGNPPGTRYLAQVSSDNFTTVLDSSETLNEYAHFTGVQSNTTHYLRTASLNAAGSVSLFAVLPATVTHAAAPLKQPDTFTARYGFSVDLQWLANGNPVGTQYLAEAYTDAGFAALVSTDGWKTGVTATLDGLDPLTTYYFRVKARNYAGLESGYANLGSTDTLTGVDTSSPTITDNQEGDLTWRGGNTAVYNVDFTDLGGTRLDKIQVRASTGPGGTGTLAFDWGDVLTNINSNSYTPDWGLTLSQWNLLKPGTNYISVRARDGGGNFKDLEDAFYVLKDTDAPTVTDNQAGETAWRRDDPGAVYEVNFNDADGGSGLAVVEYSASQAAGSANAAIVAWTALPGLTPGATFYNGPWAVNFAALTSAATNYISVRARDLAGNTFTLADAFLVLKNDSGPEVRLTAPNAGYHSVLSAITGTAVPVLEYPIEGTEISIQENTGSLYWNGADFVSATQVWLAAAGQNAWSYDTSGIAWIPGTEYQVVARSSDTAFNYSQPYSTATFTFDTSVPTVFVSTPVSETTAENPALIAGTAADAGPNSGVPGIYITLRRAVDLKWWNFFTGAWGEVAVSSMTPGGAGWAFYPDGALRGNLLHGGTYYAYASARDGAVPYNETPAGLYVSTFTVRDTIPPGDITVSTASQGELPGRLLVSWTAAGDDGAANTLAQGWFAIGYSTYPGAAFSTATALQMSTAGVVPGAQCSYLLGSGDLLENRLAAGVTYYVVLWTADEAGLWSGPSVMAAGRAGISLADTISGHVMLLSSTAVQAVMVQAIDGNLAVVQSTYTRADGSFELSGLPEGLYRVQATYIYEGFSTTIASDQVPTSYAEVYFWLSSDIELASIGGVLSAYSPAAAGYGVRAAAPAAYVELYQNSRLAAVAPVGAGGVFLISNLLPGAYSLRVPDGLGGYKLLNVTLAPGEDLRISPLGQLLRGGDVYVYPNPVTGGRANFRVETPQDPVDKLINIFDITGRVIHRIENAGFTQVTFVAPYEWRAQWDIPPGVAPGVYIYSVHLRNEATGEREKVVKKFAVVR